jgi:hypothetical protein
LTAAVDYLEAAVHFLWLGWSIVETGYNQLAYRPDMIGQAKRYRWFDPQRLVYVAKIG